MDFFWPETGGDLTQTTWAHATNSRRELEAALHDDSIMMLEADVSRGTLVGEGISSDTATPLPIMAHPPDTTSDLSLEDFLSSISKAVRQRGLRKGIKLDFKDIDVVQKSIQVLQKFEMNFPVWLNADILPGPGGQGLQAAVDASRFLSSRPQFQPWNNHHLLSLGWTTGIVGSQGCYTKEEHADPMLELLLANGLLGGANNITFPVRAALAVNSLDTLKSSAGDGATLTVWSSSGDPVNGEELARFVESVGRDKVFVDVPGNLDRDMRKHMQIKKGNV